MGLAEKLFRPFKKREGLLERLAGRAMNKGHSNDEKYNHPFCRLKQANGERGGEEKPWSQA
jgi:hypothetical protein